MFGKLAKHSLTCWLAARRIATKRHVDTPTPDSDTLISETALDECLVPRIPLGWPEEAAAVRTHQKPLSLPEQRLAPVVLQAHCVNAT